MNATGLARRAAASTIGDFFTTAARLHPDRIAAEDTVVRRSFAELDARVNRAAAVLSEFDPHGLRRFAVLSENRVEYLGRCRIALAGYKQPKQILLVPPERLARTPTGKVPRQALEAWVAPSKML